MKKSFEEQSYLDEITMEHFCKALVIGFLLNTCSECIVFVLLTLQKINIILHLLSLFLDKTSNIERKLKKLHSEEHVMPDNFQTL